MRPIAHYIFSVMVVEEYKVALIVLSQMKKALVCLLHSIRSFRTIVNSDEKESL